MMAYTQGAVAQSLQGDTVKRSKKASALFNKNFAVKVSFCAVLAGSGILLIYDKHECMTCVLDILVG
jgi:hypothetical protein